MIILVHKTWGIPFEKIFSRIAVALMILTLVAIVTCFYIGEFTYAYGLILVLFFVFAGMGQLYKLKNDEYMYKKLNNTDEYNEYTR